ASTRACRSCSASAATAPRPPRRPAAAARSHRRRAARAPPADGGTMATIDVRDLHKTYRSGEVETPVLRGVSLAIGDGEFIALMGSSGSGKTTLMNVLGCLDVP